MKMNYIPAPSTGPISGRITIPNPPPVVGSKVVLGQAGGFMPGLNGFIDPLGITDFVIDRLGLVVDPVKLEQYGSAFGYGIGSVTSLLGAAIFPSVPYAGPWIKIGLLGAGAFMAYKSARAFTEKGKPIPKLVAPPFEIGERQSLDLYIAFEKAGYVSQRTASIISELVLNENWLRSQGTPSMSDRAYDQYLAVLGLFDQPGFLIIDRYTEERPDPRTLYQ